MATLAETFVGQALQENAQRDPNPGSGFQVGAQIAMHAQDVQMQQQHLQAQQQQLKEAQLEKFAQAVEKGQQYTGKAQQNYYNKFLPQYRNALNLQHDISDDALKFNGASEEMIRRQGSLISRVNRGDFSMQQALDIYHDPQKMVDMFGGNPDVEGSAPLDKGFAEELNKAEKSAETNRAQMAKTVFTQGAEDKRKIDEDRRAGQVELSKKVAGKYEEYAAGGGRAGMDAAIEKLKGAAQALKTGKVETGGISTKIPFFKSDDAQSMINPQMAALKTEAQGALNAVLRPTLGSAFTEKEGERVLSQVWDDRQPPAVNAKKIEKKIKELEANRDSAETEFRRFGYMQAAPTKKTYNIGGHKVDEAEARRFFKAHPELSGQAKAMGLE